MGVVLAAAVAMSGCAQSAMETGAEPPPEAMPEPVPTPEPTPPPPAPIPEPEAAQLWVLVEGQGVAQFHYLPEGVYKSAGTTEAAKKQNIQNSGAYGPWQIGMHVAVLLGETYVFIPECGGSLRLASRRTPTFIDTSPHPVRLECPQ